jgi:formylmethanofuran dehydrogenase subunit E
VEEKAEETPKPETPKETPKLKPEPEQKPETPKAENGAEEVKCILCKQTFLKSQTTSLRNKPFCLSCAERMKKSAAAKGVKT